MSIPPLYIAIAYLAHRLLSWFNEQGAFNRPAGAPLLRKGFRAIFNLACLLLILALDIGLHVTALIVVLRHLPKPPAV